MKSLNNYQKLQAASLLTVAAQLGFVIRGFRGISVARGGGNIDATSITYEGRPVLLSIGTTMSSLRVVWSAEGEDVHEAHYNIRLRDDGQIRLVPIGETPEVEVPEQPTWQ